MYFDGCAHHLGCTVILRGGSTSELAKVTRLLMFNSFFSFKQHFYLLCIIVKCVVF